MTDFVFAAWETLCQLAPWLIAGALISGIIHVTLPADILKKHLSGKRGVFRAVALGVPIPLCSCGVIPTGIGLKKSGASDGAAMGFLISTPQTGVDSILVSASFFGWPFAFFKMVVAAVTGVIGGLLAKDSNVESAESKPSCCCSGGDEPAEQTIHPPATSVFRRFADHVIELVESIWKWLVLGVLVSAIISVYLPNTFQAFDSPQGAALAMLLVLALSIPLYVCATASVPIAASLVTAGFPPAAAMVFLIGGPATNFATIGAIYSQFGLRNTVTYLATILAGSVAAGFLFHFLISADPSAAGHHHHDQPGVIAQASAVLLLVSFVWFLSKEIWSRAQSVKGSKSTGESATRCH